MSYIDKVQVGDTVYDIRSEVDKTLTENNVPADAKTVGDLINSISGGDGLTSEIKDALLNCFEHVAWINEDGQDYYDALESALYPPIELASITCVYTQSGTVYTTDSLDSLKSDLVVTAHYDDSSTQTVSAYTLSGTLTTGTSTITVTHGGKTTTFNVTVTQAPLDTTVVLDTAHDGKGQSNTFGNYSNHASFCPTIKYAHESTISSGYEYIYGIIPVDATGSSTCRVWYWSDNDTGIVASAYGTGKPMNVYAESMTEGSITLTSENVALYPYLTIPIDKTYKDYAYLYVGSTGKVIFAGANTPYYGMSNISEASS